MNAWVVRAGRNGEFEDFFLQEGILIIGFSFDHSVADFADMNELRERLSLEPHNLGADIRKVTPAASQLWKFANEIQRGDIVLLPRKTPKVVAVGQVTGDYSFRADLANRLRSTMYHTRTIDWRVDDVPRSHFSDDLQKWLSGRRTVLQIKIDDVVDRIDQVVNTYTTGEPATETEAKSYVPDDETPEIDLDDQIRDRIVQMIRLKFPGTGLERLVAHILRASGYNAVETRRGPDGGIDVLAGMGDMGFGEPRLCVQVKSGIAPVGIADYNRLQGNIHGFGAQYGLLVSLGDFTSAVKRENERSFFQIRLWGPYELVDRLLETYDSLPEEIRADIPLQTRRVPVESQE